MEIRSAVAGAFATVAVAGLVFTAVAVSNAAEPVVVETPPAVVGHYSTVESQDPIVYVPEPVAVPEPAAEAPPADIPVEVFVKPQPAAPQPEPLPAPEGDLPLPPAPPEGLPPVDIGPPAPEPTPPNY